MPRLANDTHLQQRKMSGWQASERRPDLFSPSRGVSAGRVVSILMRWSEYGGLSGVHPEGGWEPEQPGTVHSYHGG